jgi:type IV fimbrial biogenesis protein FimT
MRRATSHTVEIPARCAGAGARRPLARGFTITETMVTVAVLVILAGLTLPGFREAIMFQAVKNSSFDVFSSVVFARSEAITRNNPVTLSPAGGNWASGWTISDAGGEVIRRQDPFSQVSIAGPASITFNGAGRITTGATSISLMPTDSRIPHLRCIRIDLSGRPTLRKESCF